MASPRADEPTEFVQFSEPAAYDAATLNGRPVHDAPSGAPVFDEALAWMDCEVGHSVDLGTHSPFVREIMAAQVNDASDGLRRPRTPV